MFLIGISGSLLPYLLVGGIVLLFSFNASEGFEDDADDESLVFASGHTLFSNDSSAPLPRNSFYFSPCVSQFVSSDCVHNQKQEKQSAVMPGGHPLFVSLSLRKAFWGGSDNTSRSAGFLFSGLSPPVSVIS